MNAKKLLYSICAFLIIGFQTFAQDNRTVNTKIADLLAQFPAANNEQFEKNMKQIHDLGEDGYIQLIKTFNSAGTQTSAIEYAVAGFSAYSTKNGQNNANNMATAAYCKVLSALSDKNHVAFIISQFEVMGKDNAVSCIAAYLQTEPLADPTARSLAKIGTQKAIDQLLAALSSTNEVVLAAGIEALGATNAQQAASAIIPFAAHSDKNVVKAALFALAQLSPANAAPILLSHAENAQFDYEPSNALTALLIYAGKTDANTATGIANTILKKAKGVNQGHARTAALEILAKNNTNHSALLKAMGDKNFKVRAAAVQYATATTHADNALQWTKQLKKADALTKVAILEMLANADAKIALPEVMKFLNSTDPDVQKAAVETTMILGEDAKLPDLLMLMNKGNNREITVVSDALLRMPGNGAAATIAAFIPAARPEVQMALLNVLAAKAANEQIEFVYDALKSDNATVRSAAFKALKSTVTEKNSNELYSLLRATEDPAELKAVQEAIIAANKGVQNTDTQINLLLSEMQQAGSNKKPLFYKMLASLGGLKALDAVVAAYHAGDTNAKKSAVEALSSWASADAALELIKIARTTSDADLKKQTLIGYLSLIKRNSFSPEQRLLLLRNVMELATTADVKNQVLRDLVQAKTYPAILFAGKYLDDSGTQQAAAAAVMNIAMAGKYNGSILRNLLNKTMAMLNGTDASYQREALSKYITEMETGEGFVKTFNGKDLSGWQGLVADPIKRSKMNSQALAEAQAKADAAAKESWKVLNGELHFMSKGDNLATVKKYGDIEMWVDWKIIDDKKGEGDAGIYLRGTPQVQIWDLARTNVGAQVGSGGLYNNQKNPSKPLVVADNPLDEWNTFRILMIGDRVTVYLNGQLVTDNVILENYWNRNMAIFAEEQIELQAHGSPVAYRDIYIREISRPTPFSLSVQEQKEGFKVLFDGTNMHEWTGNTTDYVIENGNIAIKTKPGKGSGGNLFTKEQFSDFNFRFEFQLTPGANNGLGIRSPLEGDAAYAGMELQILDNDAAIYNNLKEWQYHGSVYGVAAAKKGFLKPVGEWNYQEVIAQGSKIKVILNGAVIVDADIEPFKTQGTLDGQQHPGLKRDSGHIGFLGHGSPVQFRNIRIKDLSKSK